jgi:hypothetical protein
MGKVEKPTTTSPAIGGTTLASSRWEPGNPSDFLNQRGKIEDLRFSANPLRIPKRKDETVGGLSSVQTNSCREAITLKHPKRE